MAGAYRVAPESAVTTIACGPLLPWRAIVGAGIAGAAGGVVFAATGVGGVVLWAACILFVVLLLRAALRHGVRLVLHVDPHRRRLVVSSRRLFRARREELDLADARRVGLDLQRSSHWLAHLPGPALVEARLVVLDEDGTVRPLHEPRFGLGAQRRAADALAALLRLDRLPEPTLGPKSPAHPNARAYVLFATSIVAVSALGFGVQLYVVQDQGRLEVRCTTTCRFDGMTCLPGGTVAGSYPPGERLIEVEDPSARGGFRPVSVPVRVGHRTVFECRPDATVPELVPE